MLNNLDCNIYQNNRDYDFCHNRVALVWSSFMMDGYFLGDSETGEPFTKIIQIGIDRTMPNITPDVFV